MVCRLCNDHVTEVLSNFEKFKKFNEEMRKLKTDMEKKLLDFEVRIQNCEKPERNPDMTSAIEKVVERKLPSVNAESDTEKELIEKKRCNLIYFNVSECHDDNIETRIKHDYDYIKNMYGPSNASKDHISNIFRIGKKGDKPRPLIIKFTEMSVIVYYQYSFCKHNLIIHLALLCYFIWTNKERYCIKSSA